MWSSLNPSNMAEALPNRAGSMLTPMPGDITPKHAGHTMISARWPKLKEHGLTGTRGSRLTIVGGGVMGLMSAYYAAPLADSVTVLDKSRVGDPGTASFGLTRSVRNDYLDPQYSRLAFEARQLWLDLQERAGQRLLVDCGCLNLAKASVTPDIPASYAARSFAVLEDLQLRREALAGPELAERFPQFAADGGWLYGAPGVGGVGPG